MSAVRIRLWPALVVRGLVYGVALASCASLPPLAGPPPAYLSPAQIDSTALLPPPPAAGSEGALRDLQAVLDAQRSARAAGITARAVGDATINCDRFADVWVTPRGAAGLAAGLAAGFAFATRAALQVSAATGAPKRFWKRPRPFVVSDAVERLGDVAPDNPMPAAAALERDHTSYPSGHAAFGTACAIVLAQMVPEERAALFARGRAYGESRVIIGAHFPSDVEAGRTIGAAASAVMLQNAQFRADLSAARRTLREVLGLTPAP